MVKINNCTKSSTKSNAKNITNNTINTISDRTTRYLNRTIKKTQEDNIKNSKYINELKTALDYYMNYSHYSCMHNNWIINNYNFLYDKYLELKDEQGQLVDLNNEINENENNEQNA